MCTLTNYNESLLNQYHLRMFILCAKYIKRSLIFVFTIIFSYCSYASDSHQESFSFSQEPSLNAPKVYNNPIYINNELSNQSYNFNLAIFKQTVSFNEVKSNTFSFNWAVFFAPLMIYHLKINENGNFYYTIFHNKIELSKVDCENNCIFYSNIFNQTQIIHSSFKSLLSFQSSLFNKDIKIENSTFEGTVDFSYITAKGNISFDHNFFSKELLLNDSKIQGSVSFNETVPPPYLDFSRMQLGQSIDLNGMDFSNQHHTIKINILKTDVNKIKFNYNYFKLYFPADTPINLIQNTYSSLLKKFKNEGDITSYNLILAEYSEYLNLYQKKYIKNLIVKHWWNYSTNPEWIFFWMGVIILFYTIINTIFYKKITSYYLDIPFLIDTGPATIRHHPLIHFVYFLPRAFLFTIIMFCGAQFRLSIDLYAFKTNSVLINIYFLTIMLSGLVSLFFLLKYILAQLT